MTVDQKIARYFRKHQIAHGSYILVGCSGGVDSTVLLHYLGLRQSRGDFHVSCAYFDHGIRSKFETDADLKFLEQFTENLNIPFYFQRLEEGLLPTIARQQKLSLEELAREKRYAYLLQLKEELAADFLALGHTLDDHCETLIMNFFQGAGISGLCGIPEKRGAVIRPLFFCTRRDNLAYLKHYQLKHREDITNLCDDYLRNKIRLTLIPIIGQIFPGYRTALLHLTTKMSLVKSFLNNEQKSRLNWQLVDIPAKSADNSGMEAGFNEEKKAYQANAVDFFSNPSIIRLYSLYAVFDALRKDGKGIGKKRLPYRLLAPLVETDQVFNKHTLLKGLGIRLVKRGPNLFFERDIVDTIKKGYFILVDEQQKNHIIEDKIITYQIWAVNRSISMENAIYINLDYITPPLSIRSKKAGDKIQIKSGTKSIKKIFNEWGIAVDKRWQIPLIADRNCILGILGKPFGYRNRVNAVMETANKKVTEHSKFLRVEVT